MQVWVAHQNPKNPNPLILAAVFLLFSTGYTIFRQANLQKLQFRTDSSKPIWGSTPKSLKTARGTPLLLSGWWGIARKVNYTGDLLIAYSFAFGNKVLVF
jgi:delta14-sterol reductase